MPLTVGLVYDLLGTHPRAPGDPPDVDVEYEPEETIAVLEAALARLGHRPLRLGNPHQLLAALGKVATPAARSALEARLPTEPSDTVKDEIQKSLAPSQ